MRNAPGNEPVFQSPPVVLVSIAVLAAIHGALQLAGQDWQIWSLYAFAFIPARFGSEPYPMIAGSQIWSFITYSFLHADWLHLAFNGLWLLVFGTVVARFFGALRFLLLSALASVGGALAMLLAHWGDQSIMIGASGAVSGLMAAAVPIMYGRNMHWAGWSAGDRRTTRPLSFSELLHNRNALIFTAVFLAITLYSGATGFTGNSYVEDAEIAWQAHLGGFITGLMAFYLLRPRQVPS